VSERIRINYTIRLEDMRTEINRLFGAVIDEIKNASQEYSVPSDTLSQSALDTIRELRSFAYDTEQGLADIEDLIKSYLQYSTQSPQEPQAPANTDPMGQLHALKAMVDGLQSPTAKADEVTD
jgi:hypothetical protein